MGQRNKGRISDKREENRQSKTNKTKATLVLSVITLMSIAPLMGYATDIKLKEEEHTEQGLVEQEVVEMEEETEPEEEVTELEVGETSKQEVLEEEQELEEELNQVNETKDFMGTLQPRTARISTFSTMSNSEDFKQRVVAMANVSEIHKLYEYGLSKVTDDFQDAWGVYANLTSGEMTDSGVKNQYNNLLLKEQAFFERTRSLHNVVVGSDDRLTDEPIDIMVSGKDKDSVTDIELVSSPKEGRNYLQQPDRELLTQYSRTFNIYNAEDIYNEEVTFSFEARQSPEQSQEELTEIESVIFRGRSYNTDFEVGKNYKRYTITLPKADDPKAPIPEIPQITIKKGNTDWLDIRNVKLELGDTATPYTVAPEEVEMHDNSNMFDKDEWLKTPPSQKPKSTGVPYIDIQGEPYTHYTISTNITLASNGYYDVFAMNTGQSASSTRNGVESGSPRTIKTNADGIIRVAMRNHDEGLMRNYKYIQVNEGKYPIQARSKVKFFPVTANGEYVFNVHYKDGRVREARHYVNNFVNVKGIPYDWTDGNLTLRATALGGNSPIVKRIKLPNGVWSDGAGASYRVTDNGTYTFVFEDVNGEQFEKTVEITNIDKGNPTIRTTQTPENGDWTSEAVDIEVIAFDAESGVETVEMTGRPSNTIGGGENLFLNSNFIFGLRNWTDELSGELEVIDNNTLTAYGSGRFFYSIIALPRGEYYTVSFDARKDGEPAYAYPHQSSNLGGSDGSLVTNEWQRHSVTLEIVNSNTISFELEDTENKYYFRNMKLEKGTESTPWIPASGDGVGLGSSTYPVIENGTYTFTATDYAGNTAVVEHTVSNIDSTPPKIEVVYDRNKYTNNNTLTLTVNATDTQSGVNSITLPDGRVVRNKTSASYTVDKNGKYQFTVEDNVGNRKTYTETVSNFDRTPPTLTITGNPTSWTEDDEVVLTLTAKDTQSGVNYITLPDGSKVNKGQTNYTITGNGDYTFKVTDKVGNTREYTETVQHIMIPFIFYLYDSNGDALQGAEFALLRNGNEYARAISDVNGLVNFGKVPPIGDYTIKQTKAPDGHIQDPEEIEVEVDDESDPIEIISYPRGLVLPSTGTKDTWVLATTVLLITGLIISVGYKKRER